MRSSANENLQKSGSIQIPKTGKHVIKYSDLVRKENTNTYNHTQTNISTYINIHKHTQTNINTNANTCKQLNNKRQTEN